MTDKTNDDLLNELSSMPTKKEKKKGAAKPKVEQVIKEEPKIEPVKEITNDDLEKELMVSSSKGKNKGKKKEEIVQKQPEPIQEQKEEPKKEQYEITNDDLEKDIMMASSSKGKKKGKKKEEVVDKQPEPTIVAEKKEEVPAPEVKAHNEEEEGDEAVDEPSVGKEEKKKKKKVVVVKKKDKLLKLIQEQNKKKKELEEKLLREAEEEERKRREEEEKKKKEEEERLRKEEEDKKNEEERLKALRKIGVKNAAELAKLDKKKKLTEENLLKTEGKTLDEFLNSLASQPVIKKQKKAHKVAKEEEMPNEEQDVERAVETADEPIEQKEDVICAASEEVKKQAETELKFEVEGNVDDDWENAVDNPSEEQQVTITSNINNNETTDEQAEDNTQEPQEQDVDYEAETTEKSNVVVAESSCTSKKKKKNKNIVMEIVNEPEYIPTSRLRSPIVCILGHVDTGKTKILDKLRRSNVQAGEAGGITQQIGATFLPIDNYAHHLDKLPEKFRLEPKIPGFLLIDTPGHESFQNLRTRGSSLCDLAVLVVDIMHGLEKQTIDSLDLLRRRKTPFVIALNKIDRVYQWKSTEWAAFRDSYEKQKKSQTKEFTERLNRSVTELMMNNLNVSLYDENPSMKEYINIVPTSAITGEGMPDLIGLFVYLSQKFLTKKIEFREEVQCTILEVKVLEGTGTTIDVILVNGTLKVGDKIIVGGLYGPIKTTIKILLTPHPMKEMRVKSEYEKHDSISGAMGIKIFGVDLDNALAGSPLYVYQTEEEELKYEQEITQDFNSIVKDFLSKTGKGIMVQASTLGSLEAILAYLHDLKVEIAVVGVGNLNKKDVMKLKIIHAKEENPLKEDLVILAFDNKIHPEAQQFADESGIKIFSADIIYHLFISYTDFAKECILERKKAKEKEAIFPCVVQIIPSAIFNRKDPIIIGVDVIEGTLKLGTPLYCPEKKIAIGIVEGIQSNKKQVNNVKPADGSVSIRIKSSDSGMTVGRQFEETDSLVSHISRASIDALKEFFREDMTTDDWKLVIKLKKLLEIS